MRRDVFVYISGPMTAKDGRTIEPGSAPFSAVISPERERFYLQIGALARKPDAPAPAHAKVKG